MSKLGIHCPGPGKVACTHCIKTSGSDLDSLSGQNRVDSHELRRLGPRRDAGKDERGEREMVLEEQKASRIYTKASGPCAEIMPADDGTL